MMGEGPEGYGMIEEYSPDIERAWQLYCKETAGGMDVRDFWHELSEEMQQYYLKRVSPKQQAIEVLARQKNPFFWEEVDRGDCSRDNYYVDRSLKDATIDIEALEVAGLVIAQKEEDK